MTDPRAALAEAIIESDEGGSVDGLIASLAERGVRLVTEEGLRAALVMVDPQEERFPEIAAAIFAALREQP